jgi:hypothetical protein
MLTPDSAGGLQRDRGQQHQDRQAILHGQILQQHWLAQDLAATWKRNGVPTPPTHDQGPTTPGFTGYVPPLTGDQPGGIMTRPALKRDGCTFSRLDG